MYWKSDIDLTWFDFVETLTGPAEVEIFSSKMKQEYFCSDVGIQEFYKVFKYISSRSARVLLPGSNMF